MSQSMDGELGRWTRLKLRVHLLICDACSSFQRNLLLLRRAMARLHE